MLLLCKTWASTIVVSKCSDGIIIGSDSLSVSGPLIRNRVAQNVYDLDGADSVVCCCSSTTGQADFHHLLTDLQRFVRSNHEDEDLVIAVGMGGGNGYSGKSRKVGASALARYARRLITKKYRKAHVIIAGADFSDEARVASAPTAATAAAALSSLTGEQTTPRATQRPLGPTYSIHEIVDGGSHVVHDDFAVAGSGADLVHALLTNLLDSCNSNSNSNIISSDRYSSSSSESGSGIISSESGSESGGFSDSKPEVSRVQVQVGPEACARTVRQALRSAATVDPRTGAELRLWLFAADKGLRRMEVR